MNGALTKHTAWINEIFEALNTPDHVDKQEVNTQQNLLITTERLHLLNHFPAFYFVKINKHCIHRHDKAMNYTDFFWINAVYEYVSHDKTYLNFIKRVYYNTATFKQAQYIDRHLNKT